MSRRSVKRLRVVACTLAGLMVAVSIAAQNPQAAKLSEKKMLRRWPARRCSWRKWKAATSI